MKCKLLQHMNKVRMFILNNKIDIMLISKTHFTDIISKYYHTPYIAQHIQTVQYDDTATIIKSNIINKTLLKKTSYKPSL